ncbi:hypothetical protein B9479_000101 [Cryptococcus floricola]|uniref:Heme oxygenase 2 n=1 Tax=Cryptococcus floricola TaxID=2591691 RepID=A0A5D3B8A9_9TREE|nr:hypothetical protein B9479_000101 [Cryptococcus floricola]
MAAASQLHANLAASVPLTPSFQPNTPDPEKVPQPSGNNVRDHASIIADIPELDYTQPLSALLKLGTQRAHVKAEHSVGAAALVQGTLGLEEYIRWLAALWRVYDVLELGLQLNSSNPVLAPTYDPTLLARAPTLAADINYLLTLLPPDTTLVSLPASSQSTVATPLPPFPLPSFLQSLFDDAPSPLSAYVDHLRTLSESPVTAPGLLAHAYVRYLGDLSGGQFIGARVKRSYGLKGDEGTSFYQFDFQKEGAAGGDESRAELKKQLGEIKDWYRRGMDEAVGEDQKLKADLVEEANLAFALNTDLFSIIRVPSSGEKAGSKIAVAEQPKAGVKDFITQSMWFVAAAAVGMLLNIYVGPIVQDWRKGE